MNLVCVLRSAPVLTTSLLYMCMRTLVSILGCLCGGDDARRVASACCCDCWRGSGASKLCVGLGCEPKCCPFFQFLYMTMLALELGMHACVCAWRASSLARVSRWHCEQRASVCARSCVSSACARVCDRMLCAYVRVRVTAHALLRECMRACSRAAWSLSGVCVLRRLLPFAPFLP